MSVESPRLLVANRGEIAIRIMRSATELDLTTIGIYTTADRESLHRVKADESYEIGDPARPVAGYLDTEAIVELATSVNATALHPGYGFLSESPDLARACAAAGIAFIGPPAEVLEATGDKVSARQHARAAGLPVLEASDPLADDADLASEADRIGFPVFVKAAGGGGGRGLRLVHAPDQLASAVTSAKKEAQAGFGDPRVYLEKAVVRPRHIEVQVLADADGQVIHLYERDCSVQRRHQKVLEIAPAPNLDPQLRDLICADAVRFAEQVGYRNAGTVEFLLDGDGQHYFIEMNPRIQVEHTITEEICDIDLVRSQLQIGLGASFDELGLSQDEIAPRGVALQCRVTTEDPRNGFRPATGRITAFRSTGGPGVRIDAGSAHVGAEISPYFDSMLAKVTTRGRDLEGAARRARRALAEFRVRGVPTNLAFLRALLQDPGQLAAGISTAYLDEHPELLTAVATRDRASRLLQYLGDTTVHRPAGPPPGLPDPAASLPPLPQGDPPAGSRQRLLELGPDGFARWWREHEPVLVTDTTLRDAHQSLLATRMRTADMLAVAPHLARQLPELLSLEVWGGATFDVGLRFLREDPWERLERLRDQLPNLCLQMLLRGDNTVGYRRYARPVVSAFIREAADSGVDIFRIFDALNDTRRMRTAIQAVVEEGRIAEGTLCYTGDLSDPAETTYTLDHYLRVAEEVVDAGAQVLCIKDMAGLLRAPAARTLITALRERFDTPVHLHTHDTAGGQMATYLAAIEAGVDAIDGAAAPLSATTSQPPLPAIVAATNHGPRETGLDLDALIDLEDYWSAVRHQYAPFEQGLSSPTGQVYRHEIPGGQLSNLMAQANELGVTGGFPAIAERYIQANRLLGGLIKVTPTSKVVGDLAIFMAINDVDPDELEAHPERFDLPSSVVSLLAGDLGEPAGGWPEPLRTRVLEHYDRPASDEDTEDDAEVPSLGHGDVKRALSALLFPGPAAEFDADRERFGDLSVLSTEAFFYGLRADQEITVDLEPGVRLTVELEAIGEVDQTGHRSLYLKVNGIQRAIEILDRNHAPEQGARESASPDDPSHLAAQMTGVVTLSIEVGDRVGDGEVIGGIEAMKMESPVRAPRTGVVTRVVTPTGTHVEPGDLILVVGDPDQAVGR